MSLKDDLTREITAIYRSSWTERDGDKVPESEDIRLGNDAVQLDATVLYADLADSTALVDNYYNWFATDVYKAFLLCAARLIRSEGGVITAYDGDRVMGVYISGNKNTSAVRTAMKLNCAVRDIINPVVRARWPENAYELKHVVGIDVSSLFVARTGVRGANDLVWVGRAANHAAKMAALPEEYSTYVSADVYSKMLDEVKLSSDGVNMWTSRPWTEFDGRIVYGSSWQWNYFE